MLALLASQTWYSEGARPGIRSSQIPLVWPDQVIGQQTCLGRLYVKIWSAGFSLRGKWNMNMVTQDLHYKKKKRFWSCLIKSRSPVFVIAWSYHFYCQPDLGAGVGLRFLLFGPLELGSFYRQGMFLKFMCNIRMRNSLRPWNDRGDNKPWH